MDKKVKAALEIIDRVCADFRGNRKEHETIQASLQIVYAALSPKEDKKKDKKKKGEK